MTRVSEIMDCINDIEASYPVAQWRINGLRIWPLVRIRLSILLRERDFVGPKVKPGLRRGLLGLMEGFAITLFSVLQLLLWPGSWRGFSALVLTRSSGARGSFNLYSGPLQEQLSNHGIRYLAVEVSDRPIRPKWGYPVLLLDRYWLVRGVRILYELVRLFRRHSAHLPGFTAAMDSVSRRFHTVGRRGLGRKTLVRQANYIDAYRSFFGFLLGLLRPCSVYVVCYYTQPGMGLILAARERGVLSADYQHGVQGRYHYAYGSWKRFPPTGYELLPDVFLNWSDAEKKAIDEWAAPGPHRSVVVGNLLAEHLQKAAGRDQGSCAESSRLHGSKPRVLYTLQNFVPPEWIWGVIRGTSNEFKWLIRLHPQYPILGEVVRKHLGNNSAQVYDLVQASSLPLPLLLPSIDVHVTGNSSVVLEALQLGKPSIVIDHYGIEYYADLIEAKVVAAALDSLQLERQLRIALSGGMEAVSPVLDTSFHAFLDSDIKPKQVG